MPLNLAPFLPQEPDQSAVPAAFSTLISTILHKKQQAQQQRQFEAEQARLSAGDQADQTYKMGMLGETHAKNQADASNDAARLAQQGAHQQAEAQAKRREAQTTAAKVVGEALASGKQDVLMTMKPYLQSLGVTAKIDEGQPQMQPLAFSGDGIPTMDFALGKRKLTLHADGEPMGEVDLDQLEALHGHNAENLLQTMIGGASEQDQPAYAAAADAIRSNPQLLAQGGPDMLKTANDMAGKRIGIEHTDAREQLRSESADRAMQARGATAQLATERAELARHRLIAQRRDQYVNSAMAQGNQRGLVQNEQSAARALGWIDSALKSNAPLEASSKGRFAVSSAVTSMFGKNSSNKELQFVFSTSFATDAENKFNYFTGGGELAPDQLRALRGVLVQGLGEIRRQRRDIAAGARDGVMNDYTLQQLAPEALPALSGSAARQVLGASAAPSDDMPSEGMQTPGMPGSAVQNQADELRAQDPDFDATFNGLFGGDNANP